ncbi:MAG: tetratricopeptide repeat protein [Sphingomonas bacterium]|nr:tetratricopeptide repeat protein [Sphingomonas bacterium]
MERRLSAIMAADVVGYSRLMGANEVGTLNALNHRRTEVIEPRISGSNGRVVKLTGDGILAEFPSVVDAVECALAVQREMKSRNVEIPEDRRIELRIGIHLGDVIVEDGDIFGDGVNIAARIESVGRPGGVAVSAAVKENVGNRLDVAFEDMGEHQLKNIAQSVRVYEVATAKPAAGKAAAAETEPETPDKPSIAVLPFNNMSGDPEQEFFSDGISEDIITDLSKISGLFVVGRNTSFIYKGKSIQLQQVASELGVKFLLEGSVRKAGDRVRVTGQLIDGATGGHVWADRYDRDLTDIFAIQDEITKTIVDQLKIRLLPEEKKAIAQAPTGNVEAYTSYLKGREYYHYMTKRFLRLARQMFTKATELDPNFARAYAGIANCDARLIGMFGEPIPAEEILAVTAQALALDPDLAEAHAAHGEALAVINRSDEARIAFERALQLDPNSFEANYSFGRFCFRTNEHERAVLLYKRALELQPDDSQAPLMLALTLQSLGRVDEANEYGWLGIKRAEEQLRQHPESSRPAQLGGVVLAKLGETERGKEWMERALEIDPDDRLALYNAACLWAQIGVPDRAIDFLERWSKGVAVETREWIKHDPDIHPLRTHPRYEKLIESIMPVQVEGAP